MNQASLSRRKFLQRTSALAASYSVARFSGLATAATESKKSVAIATNTPETILSDPRVHLKFEPERLIMDQGVQPFMLRTKSGALVLQAQVPRKPHPQQRIFYPTAIATVISRNDGKTWSEFPLKPNDNGVNMEGGAIQLRDGTILVLETYVTPGDAPGKGMGLLYESKDDWRTLEGPIDITFDLPGTNFYGSTDDSGRPHAAMRLHRRILELPNGDLITTLYGWMQGDEEPSGYTPTMRKTRAMLLRSRNRGRHWELVSTIAADSSVGTEGFDEPALVRISHGPRANRLICFMRTGRELFEAVSDDEGQTWSKAKPRIFANLDIYRTELWAEMFKGVKRNGKLIEENPNEFIGAVVDPDLIELRSGVLVAAFGVRVPPRACWANPKHPWNGNYLAFSLDHGETWSHVVRLTSGISTTHYQSVEELRRNNRLFVAYDFGWTKEPGRYTYGRQINISVSKS